MANKLFIFDFDKTILDLKISMKQILETKAKINERFQEYGLPLDTLRPLIPKIYFLSKLATKNLEEQEQIVKYCFSLIDEIETNPEGGVDIPQTNMELLKDLSLRQYKMGIISNNGRKGVYSALRVTGIPHNFFEFILTRDDVLYPKPFLDPYIEIKKYLATHECYFFTDDILDFLPLMYSRDFESFEIEKYIVLNIDVKNMSYNWVTGEKMDFDRILDQVKGCEMV